MRVTVILAALTLIMAAGSSVIDAAADNSSAGACSITGELPCSASDEDDSGSWHVYSVAGSTTTTDETCAGATSISASFAGTGPEGAITGRLDPTRSLRLGVDEFLSGVLDSAGETHTFHAHLLVQPVNGVCAGGSGATNFYYVLTGSASTFDE